MHIIRGIGADMAVTTLIGANYGNGRQWRSCAGRRDFSLCPSVEGRRLSLLWEELSDFEGTSYKGGP